MSLLNDIVKEFPHGSITKAVYEGANVVLYTKDKNIFENAFKIGAVLAKKYKKRIEIRMDPSMLLPESKALEIIKKYIPEEAKLKNVFFEKGRSIVTIECQKPEKIPEENLEKIRLETNYVPKLKRAPIHSSKIIDAVRAILHKESYFRSEFLHKLGEKINVTPLTKRRWIRLTVLGSGREVGRSCLLLQTQEANILLDCGVGVSVSGPDAFPYFDAPEFDINQLDAIIITHSHLDHCGAVPFLIKLGYKGPIYCTEPTRDLAALVMLDYVKVCEQQLKQKVYSSKEIKEFIKRTVTINYNEVTDIAPGIKLCFYNAGHILGSAMVHLNIENQYNILYTGDLKFARTRLLDRPPTNFPRVETLIIESTYGGREDIHPPREETEKRFIQAVKEVIEKGGKVLIPVLAVGRAQEILLLIIDAIRNNLIPEVPVYLEGILWETTQIHTAYPEFLSRSLREEIYNDKNPFEAEFVIRASPKEREDIMHSNRPAIVIATSGMMNGGPIVDYFRLGAEDEKNALFFVSYQAVGTLGRRILEGEREIQIGNEIVKVKLRVEKFDGFSGHSDRRELINFVKKMNPKPKNIIIVHGEQNKPFDLADGIKKSLKRKFNLDVNIYVPNNLDAIRLL